MKKRTKTNQEVEVGDQRFVEFLVFKADPVWRRLDEKERQEGREGLARVIEGCKTQVTTYPYSTVGLKAGTDLFLWRISSSLEVLQETAGQLLKTGLGRYLEIVQSFVGLIRPSVYVKKQEPQEQAVLSSDRLRYLIFYPFVKTKDWYLLSKEVRQGMMNQHIRIGHEYPAVRQVLVHSFGLDDQEFVVAYETNDLKAYQDLVMALREVEVRRYTLRDTPVITGVHRPLKETLELLG